LATCRDCAKISWIVWPRWQGRQRSSRDPALIDVGEVRVGIPRQPPGGVHVEVVQLPEPGLQVQRHRPGAPRPAVLGPDPHPDDVRVLLLEVLQRLLMVGGQVVGEGTERLELAPGLELDDARDARPAPGSGSAAARSRSRPWVNFVTTTRLSASGSRRARSRRTPGSCACPPHHPRPPTRCGSRWSCRIGPRSSVNFSSMVRTDSSTVVTASVEK
jgi:hypothetical protein